MSFSSRTQQRIARRIKSLLSVGAFLDALPGHLEGDAASQARLNMLTERLRALAAMSEGDS
ncbi:MAG: hypothetical protein HYY06_08320 [Deltaproteobacteria bacterium]|nr:hypothetical protein [Deltaproteobacteria bacterium]